jgi:prepilin-type N-terminal cleavage/methylation domain-containing protein
LHVGKTAGEGKVRPTPSSAETRSRNNAIPGRNLKIPFFCWLTPKHSLEFTAASEACFSGSSVQGAIMKPFVRRGMSLTEIMVVIAIISIVSSIMLLSFGKVRQVIDDMFK